MLDVLQDAYAVGLIIIAVVINLAALGLKMQRVYEQRQATR